MNNKTVLHNWGSFLVTDNFDGNSSELRYDMKVIVKFFF